MKIVSGFKDYYDALRSLDRDPEPLYLRETRRFALNARDVDARERRAAADPLWTDVTIQAPLPGDDLDDDARVAWRRGIVAFCGRLFPFFRASGVVRYDLAAFDVERAAPRARRSRWRPHRDYAAFLRARTRTVDDDVFRFFDAPVLEMTDEEIVVNPSLKALDFATQVDPYTAWQDLSMFLGNNLVKNTPPQPVSDDIKAHAHGFDKHSFKKAKAPRKKVDRSEW
ncbi:MAG TPA: hypothetical protein VGO62_18490 [Myxococcota bacterium]